MSTYGERGTSAAGIENLQVLSRGGKVVIRGSVSTQEEKDNAGARAAELVGAQNVTNELKVRKGSMTQPAR